MGRPFEVLHPALSYAVTHLDEDLSLAVLARKARLSPFHLHRLFTERLGQTPKELTEHLRLNYSAALLLTSEETILDIALSCGFQSHEVFTRAFRRRFGMSPRSYRKRGFAAPVDAAQAETHRRIVAQVAPCVGLYHLPECRKTEREIMSYTVTTVELAPQPVLLARKRVKRSDIGQTIGELLSHVFHFAQQHGVPVTGFPLTRYRDVSAGLLTMEPGMRVAAVDQDALDIDPAWTQIAGSIEVRRDLLPGGLAATAVHCGPYDKLPDAYAAVEQWFESQGWVAADAPWECYLTDPAQHPDPKDWKTSIFWPIKKR